VAPELENGTGTFYNQHGEQITPCPWLLEKDKNVQVNHTHTHMHRHVHTHIH
jgi:hypothetical protein